MMGRGVLVILAALSLSSGAVAQDPSVNDSDYNTTPPTGDDAYLDQAEAESNGTSSDPSVNDSDFDTSTPSGDDAYLNEAEAEANGSSSDPSVDDSDFDTSMPSDDDAYLDAAEDEMADGSAKEGRDTPAAGVFVLLVALGALALVRRR